MNKVERLEKELLETLGDKYGRCNSQILNDNIYVFIEDCERLFKIINCVEYLNEIDDLDNTLMSICEKYNYDYEVIDDYTIYFHKC